MANGNPRRPVPRVSMDTLRIAPEIRNKLRETQTFGLLDTLIAIAGAAPESIKVLRGNAPSTIVGYHVPGAGIIELATDVEKRLFTETLAHEFGHFLSDKFKGRRGRVPSVEAVHEQGDPESGARPFARSVLALRQLARDTANTEGILEQFERGIHPSLSLSERGRGNIPGTQFVVAELLGLPIFRQHPSRPHRERLLREASTVR